MMVVTATEFKTNFGRYLELLRSEDIYITKNGKTVAKMVNPNVSAVDQISGNLEGQLPDEYDAKKLREERMENYETSD